MTDEERAELARQSLYGEADRRIRAAVAAADELERSDARDKRTPALRIVRVLAEAAELRRAGDALANIALAAPAEQAKTSTVGDGLPTEGEQSIMGDDQHEHPLDDDPFAEDAPTEQEVHEAMNATTGAAP